MTGPRIDESPSGSRAPGTVFVVVSVEEDYVTLLTKTPQGAIAVTKVEHKNLFIAKNGGEDLAVSKRIEQRVSYVLAAVLVFSLLSLAVYIPDPRPFQYTVFRIVLAIAIAGLAAMIPGFLEVTISKWLRAGGALAVFVIVYFFSPAQLIVERQGDANEPSSSLETPPPATR